MVGTQIDEVVSSHLGPAQTVDEGSPVFSSQRYTESAQIPSCGLVALERIAGIQNSSEPVRRLRWMQLSSSPDSPEVPTMSSGPDHVLFDNPWEWESIIFRAGLLPDNVEEVDIRPLKTLVRAVAAFDEPGKINGPQPSIERLLRLSSVAWGVYNRLRYIDALTDDEQAEPEPPSAKDSSSASTCAK